MTLIDRLTHAHGRSNHQPEFLIVQFPPINLYLNIAVIGCPKLCVSAVQEERLAPAFLRGMLRLFVVSAEVPDIQPLLSPAPRWTQGGRVRVGAGLAELGPLPDWHQVHMQYCPLFGQ